MKGKGKGVPGLD